MSRLAISRIVIPLKCSSRQIKPRIKSRSSSNTNATGNSLDNTLTGNSGVNILTGDAGHDTLNGGSGADTLIGGAGNDTYVVDNASDVVTENASEGTDLVQSSVDFTLGSNIENLTLTGSAIIGVGNSLDNILTGNNSGNTLDGGIGNDTIDGSASVDTLIGGVGDDIFVVTSGDIVLENASEGTDTVQASFSYTLTAANVENLVLTGSSNLNGTGNSLDNIITGNSGNNSLTGGTGADALIGGAGNDTYFIDNVGDIVTENSNEGTDAVQSSVNFTLGSNVENLTLTGSALIGVGNSLDNILCVAKSIARQIVNFLFRRIIRTLRVKTFIGLVRLCREFYRQIRQCCRKR